MPSQTDTRSAAHIRDITDASTGEVVAQVPDATAADVHRAIDSAGLAANGWRNLGTHERSAALSAFASAVEAHAEELALLDARNSGNPIRTTRNGVATGVRALRFFAGLGTRLTGETIPVSPQHLHYTSREPYGVVGVITPFNHPTLYSIGRTAAALAAGNCVILKPAHQTPLSALRVAEIAGDCLPPGVYGVVAGGQDTGAAIVRHPAVRRIAFTGSLRTALRMQADAATAGVLKRFTFELGGKNPLIALPDSDPARVADAAIAGMSLSRVLGQSCGSTSRLFVHETQHKEVVARVRSAMERMRFGNPTDEATELGCLVSDEHRASVEAFVSKGVSEGAELVLGGARPTEAPFDKGFYYPPTLFDHVDPAATIATEEIFGPVLSVIPWSDLDEMVAAVNSVRYGLTASIYTNDLVAAHRLARQIQAGYIWINDVEKRWVGVPFGGQKDSGIGTEYSEEELYSFTVGKTVSIALE